VRDRSTFGTFRIVKINLDTTTKLYIGFGLDKEKTSLVLCEPGVIGECFAVMAVIDRTCATSMQPGFRFGPTLLRPLPFGYFPYHS